jgi:hypothetical protein
VARGVEVGALGRRGEAHCSQEAQRSTGCTRKCGRSRAATPCLRCMALRLCVRRPPGR